MSAQPRLIRELENVIACGSTQRRNEILWQITNLFTHGSQRFSEDEIDLFDAVMTRLAVEIEASVRALLAQHLAPLAKAPPNITRILASDDDIQGQPGRFLRSRSASTVPSSWRPRSPRARRIYSLSRKGGP